MKMVIHGDMLENVCYIPLKKNINLRLFVSKFTDSNYECRVLM